jgi:hypothetical protein
VYQNLIVYETTEQRKRGRDRGRDRGREMGRKGREVEGEVERDFSRQIINKETTQRDKQIDIIKRLLI